VESLPFKKANVRHGPRQVRKIFENDRDDFSNSKKIHSWETSETTERPRCVESGLATTDATAPAASRYSPQSAAPREGVMEFAAM
jgi:hypothetical protein